MWFVALVTAVVAAAGPGRAADLLLPPQGAVVDGATAGVLGTAPPGQAVTVLVEWEGGRQEVEARKLPGGGFLAEVPLATGLNRVRVGTAVREVYRPGPGEDGPPRGFRPLRLHGGTIGRCDDCHLPDLAVRGGGYPDVCLVCHVVEAQNPAFQGDPLEDPHFRSAGRQCGKCHDPHGAADPKLLTAPVERLCARCHGTRGTEEGVHPAFEEGGCLACHDPHFSGYPQQLKAPVVAVCRECHEQGEEGNIHPAAVEGRACPTCHDPHGAGNALLRKPVPEMCAGCHPGPVRDGHGEELGDCVRCHDPHGPSGTALATGDLSARCRECHDEGGREKVPHAALDEGCPACHDPHTPRPARLRAPQPDVCGDCHDLPEEARGIRVHPAADTCTDCHEPHGGPAEGLLSRPVPDLCLECHDDPRQAGANVHPALEEGCLACHDPHQGRRPGLLTDPQSDLCVACHEVEQHAPAARACTACHDPHASDGDFLLRAR